MFHRVGRVTYDGLEQVGVITLEQYATDILIGMVFLRQFKLALMMVKGPCHADERGLAGRRPPESRESS